MKHRHVAMLGVLLAFGAQAAELKPPKPEELERMAAAMPAAARIKPAKPRKLLIFTRCQGYAHASIPYAAKALEMMGKKTGAFEATVTDDIAAFEPASLKSFDAVCMDHTTMRTFLPDNYKQLPDAEKKAADARDARLKKSFLDFVAGGKGLVGIHAATDCFYAWHEYGDMIGGYFWGHPWHEFVRIKLDDPSHPLCAGFKGRDFTIKDEIYQFRDPYSRNKLRVLLSIDTSKTNMNKGERIHRTDGDFAVSWIRSYGKGRVFYCSLGHRKETFWNPLVLRYYLDGIQFALGDLPADTTPSAKLSEQYLEKSHAAVKDLALNALFADLATYTLGGNDGAVRDVTEMVLEAQRAPERLRTIGKRLAALLQDSKATPDAKRFACRQLYLMGSTESVPALAALLKDDKLFDMALYALERMPCPDAGAALRAALPQAKGRVRIGVVNSLGERRDAQALPAIAALLADPHAATARAVACALGKIRGDAAVAPLKQAQAKAAAPMRAAIDDALLGCAQGFLEAGDAKKAAALYQTLRAQTEPKRVQIAAFRGLAAAQGAAGLPLVLEALASDDADSRGAAMHFVRTLPGAAATKAFADLALKLDPAAQAMTLYALGDRGDKAALSAAVAASQSQDESVRVAALSAMGRLGDASVAQRLATAAAKAKARSAEKTAARTSLDQLPGQDVDAALAALMTKADVPVRRETVVRLKARRAAWAVPALLDVAAKDEDSGVRKEAWRALATLAAQPHLPRMVAILVANKGSEQTEAEKAVAAVALKIGDEARRCDAVLAALGKATEPKVRGSLLTVLGRIGSPAGMDAVRAATKDANKDVQTAAVRALSNWPNAAAVDALAEIAEKSTNTIHRVLALRGYARLIALPSDRPTTESVALYKRGLKLAFRDDERRLLLAGLGGVPHPDALKLAEAYFDNPALQAEATMTAGKIFHGISAPKEVTASRNAANALNAIDGDMNTRWSTNEPQKPGQWYMLDLGYDREIRKITLDAGKSRSDYPKGYEVYVSRSKDDFGAPVAKGIGKTTVVDIAFKPKVGRYIKIVQTRKLGGWYWSIHDLRINDKPAAMASGKLITDRSGWKMSASVANEDAKNAIDGDMKTRWGTHGPQKDGQWLAIDLGAAKKVCKVILDAGRSTSDYPRALKVFVSADGKDWGLPVAGGEMPAVPRTLLALYPKTGRYVKIVQTGSTDRFWWSVYDVKVFAE